MGFAKALVFVQLSILLLNSLVRADFWAIEAQAPVPPRHHGYYAHPIAAPAHPPTHGGHHHHHPKPHPHPPTAAPVHPPVHPPAHAPAPHHHHHAHPPSHAPAHSPYHHAPVQPPSHPPTHPAPPAHAPAPVHPPKKPFPRSFVAVQGVVYCKSCKYSGIDTLLNATAIAGATVKLQCNNTKYPLVVTGKTDKNGYFFITAPKTITTYGAHKCKASLVSTPTTACAKITDFHGGLTGAALKPTKPFLSEKKLPFLLYTVGPFATESKCPR
ncbi:non-classical arabinogalactan protein 31-like [Argentina anserina]|uniref:non-classical arabinogalactan protein 31-like n=1 Tax=Argentina anserina TaxID=57926 RepID=UPI0021761E3A|nr:non-classical arabinogalactan protein 31-like [Potentilla anserina]